MSPSNKVSVMLCLYFNSNYFLNNVYSATDRSLEYSLDICVSRSNTQWSKNASDKIPEFLLDGSALPVQCKHGVASRFVQRRTLVGFLRFF